MHPDRTMPVRPQAVASRSRPGSRSLWPAMITGIAVLVWMTGCAVRRPATLPPPIPSESAETVLARARGINQGLEAFKGVGRLEIETPEFRRAGRAAWAGRLAGPKFRLDLMGAGLPAASLSGDGQRLYWRQSADGDVQSQAATNPRLDDLLGLPLTVSDLLHAMAGRLPEMPYQRTSVHPGASADRWHLVFYDHFGTPRIQAALEDEGRQIRRLALYRTDGSLGYRVDYQDEQVAGAYRLPHRIEVGDGQSTCRIQVDRWWPDAALNDGVFVLAPARP
ncbi:MAG: lipoprotein insertase outer membrane protein LolB [Desulfobacterales bacterium]|nr:lipoprotein insertase outer membrane protein LolB [Desulfobacteraceae bacterium]MDD3991125.1 lipoprotein insertase outer membrane protein LolB [Desulfobacteraceae bacterium]MDY0312294.1 lipoprotein insertase outer membrane protein LolB [Desulfobacterales bacterium]